jgi:long-chain acyl-CoA synthetase
MTPTTTTDAAALVEQRQKSYGQMFTDRVSETPDGEAFRYLDGGTWVSLTWKETKERVDRLVAGLVDIGVESEDRVAIASGTRIEWILADLAIACAAAATTTIYPTTSFEDVCFILANSGSKVLIAENADQAAKVLEHRDLVPDLRHVVVIDGEVDGAISWADLQQRGTERLKAEPGLVDAKIESVKPEDLATLIYTSGTTGQPKGVRLVHDSWTYVGRAVELLDILHKTDVQYLWLPLSHVFGKVLLAVQFRTGFVTAVDGNLDKIVENLGVVKPTFMAGAPRIFEKVRARVTMTAQGEGGPKAKIFDWAIGVGIKASQLRRAGKPLNPLFKSLLAIADKLVFTKVRHRLGGNIRFFVSGSAALSLPVAEWFDAVRMPIIQGYGLTETSAASCVNLPTHNVLGTVGPPIPGTEVKIASDGEILFRSPGVMRGYHDNPEATREVLSEDGWLATGDIGEVTEEGYVRVTDRKKDLIKTSGGKYVAPQKIEILFKSISPYASQIVVHGEGRKFVSALITLDPDAVKDWAKEHGHADESLAALSHQQDLHDMIQGQVDELNAHLERWETIKKFAILDRDLTIEDGELTPSMKVRRRNVEREHKELLDSLYKE